MLHRSSLPKYRSRHKCSGEFRARCKYCSCVTRRLRSSDAVGASIHHAPEDKAMGETIKIVQHRVCLSILRKRHRFPRPAENLHPFLDKHLGNGRSGHGFLAMVNV